MVGSLGKPLVCQNERNIPRVSLIVRLLVIVRWEQVVVIDQLGLNNSASTKIVVGQARRVFFYHACLVGGTLLVYRWSPV